MSWLHPVAFGSSTPLCGRVAKHDNPTSGMTTSRKAGTLLMMIPYGPRLHVQSRVVLRLLQGGILAWATATGPPSPPNVPGSTPPDRARGHALAAGMSHEHSGFARRT